MQVDYQGKKPAKVHAIPTLPVYARGQVVKFPPSASKPLPTPSFPAQTTPRDRNREPLKNSGKGPGQVARDSLELKGAKLPPSILENSSVKKEGLSWESMRNYHTYKAENCLDFDISSLQVVIFRYLSSIPTGDQKEKLKEDFTKLEEKESKKIDKEAKELLKKLPKETFASIIEEKGKTMMTQVREGTAFKQETQEKFIPLEFNKNKNHTPQFIQNHYTLCNTNKLWMCLEEQLKRAENKLITFCLNKGIVTGSILKFFGFIQAFKTVCSQEHSNTTPLNKVIMLLSLKDKNLHRFLRALFSKDELKNMIEIFQYFKKGEYDEKELAEIKDIRKKRLEIAEKREFLQPPSLLPLETGDLSLSNLYLSPIPEERIRIEDDLKLTWNRPFALYTDKKFVCDHFDFKNREDSVEILETVYRQLSQMGYLQSLPDDDPVEGETVQSFVKKFLKLDQLALKNIVNPHQKRFAHLLFFTSLGFWNRLYVQLKLLFPKFNAKWENEGICFNMSKSSNRVNLSYRNEGENLIIERKKDFILQRDRKDKAILHIAMTTTLLNDEVKTVVASVRVEALPEANNEEIKIIHEILNSAPDLNKLTKTSDKSKVEKKAHQRDKREHGKTISGLNVTVNPLQGLIKRPSSPPSKSPPLSPRKRDLFNPKNNPKHLNKLQTEEAQDREKEIPSSDSVLSSPPISPRNKELVVSKGTLSPSVTPQPEKTLLGAKEIPNPGLTQPILSVLPGNAPAVSTSIKNLSAKFETPKGK